jgi:ferredoxin
MRVYVNFAECDSNGLCVLAAPEIFELDDAEMLHVRDERPAAEMWPAVEEAARACPKIAISLRDDAE